MKDSYKLQEQLDYIFGSGCLDYATQELAKKYSIGSDRILELSRSICDDFYLEDFNVQVGYFFPGLNDRLSEAADEILGKVILPVARLLDDASADKALKDRGVEIGNFQNYIDIARIRLERKAMEEEDKALSRYEKDMAKPEALDSVLDVFRYDLADVIKAANAEATANLNGHLAYLLHNNGNLKSKLLAAINENDEVVTEQELTIDGNRAIGSVSNWIADFVAHGGSDNSDMVSLSNYITNSSNCRSLSDRDRELLSHLLITYRNIREFPDCFANLPPEKWQIIPIDESKLPVSQIVDQVDDANSKRAAVSTTSRVKVAQTAQVRPGVEVGVNQSKFPLTKDQMRSMSPIERMVAMQEYGLDEAEWERLAS